MLIKKKHKTNVVWSFETNCLNDELVATINEEAVDAVRLVSETGDGDKLYDFLAKLRQGATKNRVVPVLVDILAKVRATLLLEGDSHEFKFGEKITLGRNQGPLQLRTDEWETLLEVGANMFIGNGSVVMKPLEISSDKVQVEVMQGGVAFPGMEVHVPRTRRLPKFSDLAAKDLAALVKHRPDSIVVPGFESVEDLKQLNQALQAKLETPPWLILKVATERIVKLLPEFLPHVKGVLISRVELAMSMEPALVPMTTKEVIQRCNNEAKVVYVASEILGSMRFNATPTRAEVSDIANAVLDGADGVVLSEELPHGKYAKRGLTLARKTVEDAETLCDSHSLNWLKRSPMLLDELHALTYSAYKTAHRNKAKAIVCITKVGNTALLLASFRTTIPIIAITMSDAVLRQLALVRGVSAIILDDLFVIDEVLPLINKRLVEESWLQAGDRIVFVSLTISSVGQTASNLFTVQTLF